MSDDTALLKTHMEILCETIGARPTGSANNKAAVDYAFAEFQKCGLAVRKQEFACMDWVSSGAKLLVDGHDIPALPAEYSLPCDVEAEFICIDTVDALKKAELSGKIAVLHGDLCKEPLMPKNFVFWNPDEHKQIIALLEEKNPKAIITVSPMPDIPIAIIQDGDFNIPCAAVCGDALDAFLKSSNWNAKLVIQTERIPSTGHNVIAIHGTGRAKVCFSAHIDTKPGTPGALDNASGASVLLALAASLSGKEYPYQIEFVLFNGEDYYSIPGEMAYMPLLSSEYVLAINVDGIGLRDSDTSVSFYECPQELEKRIMECAEKADSVRQVEPWPTGDHMMFASAGIPSVAVTACDIFSVFETVIHTPEDNMGRIDLDILDNTVHFLQSCI